MPPRPLIAILAIATLAERQEQVPRYSSSYGLYLSLITPVMARLTATRTRRPCSQPSQLLPGHDLGNAAAHAFCHAHRSAACVTHETDPQALIDQCSGIGARAPYIRASYVGYMANGFSRSEALSEAFNAQPMSGDEENWDWRTNHKSRPRAVKQTTSNCQTRLHVLR
jgi:hypothetical protein